MLLANTGRPCRTLAAMILAALFIFAGCGTLQETPQQQYVWAMYQGCQNPMIRIERVEPDRRYFWQATVNGTVAVGQFGECMKKQYQATPYEQWVKVHSAATPTATRNLSTKMRQPGHEFSVGAPSRSLG